MTNYNLFPNDAMGEKYIWIKSWENASFSYFKMLLWRTKIEKNRKQKMFDVFNTLEKIFNVHSF